MTNSDDQLPPNPRYGTPHLWGIRWRFRGGSDDSWHYGGAAFARTENEAQMGCDRMDKESPGIEHKPWLFIEGRPL